MATYRERRERRAERLRGWADGRADKAQAAFGRAEEIASGIPFGQPILVGHHSEGRARRDQARIVNGMRAGIEHSDKAAEHARKAAEIERQAAHAIYSDDVDALERLRERLEGLEAERARVKAYNASCRRGAGDLSLLSDGQRAELATVARVASYQLRDNGAAPAYWLANLSGNIGRQRKRLGELERRAEQRAHVADVLEAERELEAGGGAS